MEILFSTLELEAIAMSKSALSKVFGGDSDVACRRLYELAAMDTLAVAASLPMHKLTQAGKSRFSISITPTYKILFEAILASEVGSSGSELDLGSVTAIRIIAMGTL
ncbi:hypothetical protein C798_00630 [Herbaspirillum rubrisubalbicans Os34]|uniref:Uncharacterized protein n=1 Tax=Herbaspirillum rubrisubalbicans Os34 TaxID=1235827 RepID=A0A6M3ZJH1_9BURK|nr:hypothetical protein [Herbaspirillum rubrisubalbicans]QJP98785.1 hypothetical protein C798_00630 [Herbaspirillum rubrisubalbicans Os34]